MYLPIPTEPDCPTAWLKAVKAVDALRGREAYNVILDIEDPIAHARLSDPVVAEVDTFLRQRRKSISTIANTIFPEALYVRHGSPAFATAFRDRVLPKTRRTERWSGYYFERMTDPEVISGPLGPLGDIVRRMGNPGVRARNKFELSLFDPRRDVDDSVYGGQCLSFLSFKILAGSSKRITLLAQYRNHYYIEKLLGNLIGLGRLMKFVATETGLAVGPLTVVSTHALIDLPNSTHSEVGDLVKRSEAALSRRTVAPTSVRSTAA